MLLDPEMPHRWLSEEPVAALEIDLANARGPASNSAARLDCKHILEGGLIRFETLIELKSLNSSCSSLSSYWH